MDLLLDARCIDIITCHNTLLHFIKAIAGPSIP